MRVCENFKLNVEISDEAIQRFCKNSADIKVINFSALNSNGVGISEDEFASIYYLFIAANKIYSVSGRYPGSPINSNDVHENERQTIADSLQLIDVFTSITGSTPPPTQLADLYFSS